MKVIAALALLSHSTRAISSPPRGWSLVDDAPADLVLDLTFMLTLPKDKVELHFLFTQVP